MCTAASFSTKAHYFGRNLDLEYSYHETVTVTPRNYLFHFRKMGDKPTHYAMIGMAFVADNYPLYYDATNECGLSMAGLNFPGNAVYRPMDPGKDNVAPFEFIPWILSQCATADEAETALKKLNLVDHDFSEQLPASPLHWIVADAHRCLVVEPMADGLHIYDNPYKVLTNNPPFDFHLLNITQYLSSTREEVTSRFSAELDIPMTPFSRGMGSFGIPGDLSSASRFVKAAYTRGNSVCGDSESESISQFFHILGSVAQQKGCCRVGSKFEYTIYSSCCNTDTGVYYYTTYENSQITAVDMHKVALDSEELVIYPLVTGQQINYQN